MFTREELLFKYHQFLDLDETQKILHENHKEIRIASITNKDGIEKGILLVGFNPSSRNDTRESIDYIGSPDEMKAMESDVFWGPKHRMLGWNSNYNYDRKCSYIDLFPIRNGTQTEIHDDCRNEIIRPIMGSLLGITQDYIEELKPRLIIYANTSSGYWGFENNKPGDGFWMGYKRERLISPLEGKQDKGRWKFWKITGIEPSGVNKLRTTTQLQNSYFLQYRQHKARFNNVISPGSELTPSDIKDIVEWIDSVWAKTLL